MLVKTFIGKIAGVLPYFPSQISLLRNQARVKHSPTACYKCQTNPATMRNNLIGCRNNTGFHRQKNTIAGNSYEMVE